MDDLISRQAALDALNEVRDLVWEVDIPSPTVPEYIEHHEQMKSIMRNIDVITKRIAGVPSAQQWTYVEEALPKTMINEHTKDYQEYICLCDFGVNGFDVRTYKFGDGHFWNGGGIVDQYVTAWQELPKVPEKLRIKT